jgi:hypothetical protein
MHREARLALAHRSNGPVIPLSSGRKLGLALLTLAAAGLAACEGGASPSAPTGTNPPPDPGSPPPLPAVPEVPQPHACNLRVGELSVYQGVRVPLLRDGEVVGTRNVPLIEGRPAFFRANLAYDGTPVVGNATARLKVESSAGVQEYEAGGLVAQPSTEAIVESSLNFSVPGTAIRADTRVSVTLHLGSTCGAPRTLPAGDPLPLQPTDTGVLKVVLVPIQYDADGSGRLPNLSPEQVDRYRDVLMAQYPTRQVDITVRDPVSSRIALTANSGWPQTLDALREQRARDSAARDVYYYGLVEPAMSFNSYCSGACVAGLSYLVDSLTGTRAVGIGIGFTTGSIAGETLVHELGHQHGRGHSPCGGGAGIDSNYPHAGGGIGEWGLDIRYSPPRIQSPATRKDLMGYCNPQWISDYTYNAIAERRSAVSASALVARELRGFGEPLEPHRTLLADGAGRASWGRPLLGDERPAGRPERAHVLDAQGVVIDEITVYRTDYGHGGGASFDVPVARPGWVSLAVEGLPPVDFVTQGAPVPSLQPALAR